MATMLASVGPVRVQGVRRVAQRSRSVAVRVIPGFYNEKHPDPNYIDAVLDAFPDAAVANPDEARVRPPRNHYNVHLWKRWDLGTFNSAHLYAPTGEEISVLSLRTCSHVYPYTVALVWYD